MKSLSRKSRANKTSLGDLLKEKRQSRSLSQKEVSRKLKISAMFLSNIELNKCPIPTRHLKKLISIYKLDKKEVITLCLKEEESRLKAALR